MFLKIKIIVTLEFHIKNVIDKLNDNGERAMNYLTSYLNYYRIQLKTINFSNSRFVENFKIIRLNYNTQIIHPIEAQTMFKNCFSLLFCQVLKLNYLFTYNLDTNKFKH